MQIILNHEIHNPQAIDETIVMVHGLQSSLRTFDCLVSKFPSNWKIITVDQRGHGESPVNDEDFSSNNMAKDLKKLIDKLEIEHFHLLGHSMGGRTALSYASLFPEKLKSLLIEDIGIEIRREEDSRTLENYRKLFQIWKNHNLEFESIEEILSVLKPIFSYAESLVESKVEKLPNGQFKLGFNPGVAALYGYQGNLSDLSKGVKDQIFPIIFLVADFKVGSAMTQKSLDYIKQIAPNAQIEYFKNAWHNIHKSKTDQFVEVVKNFIING